MKRLLDPLLDLVDTILDLLIGGDDLYNETLYSICPEEPRETIADEYRSEIRKD